MRVLLDTNIIIHREASKVLRPDIGILFNWMDKLGYEKCVHPLTNVELQRYKDSATVQTMQAKVANYNTLRTEASIHQDVSAVCDNIDVSENDRNDTKLLNEVYNDRVDTLISEDKKVHTKATLLGIADRVFHIDTFLEKVTAEHPKLKDYKGLSSKKTIFWRNQPTRLLL